MDRNKRSIGRIKVRINVALRKESVDRNYPPGKPLEISPKSLSARRAWIEIAMTSQISVSTVSLSARRAWIEIRVPSSTVIVILVALRKESVDRNSTGPASLTVSTMVALRKESVDRNIHTNHFCICVIESLSARRAWIEISMLCSVAKFWESLSARRAWIEIQIVHQWADHND